LLKSFFHTSAQPKMRSEWSSVPWRWGCCRRCRRVDCDMMLFVDSRQEAPLDWTAQVATTSTTDDDSVQHLHSQHVYYY